MANISDERRLIKALNTFPMQKATVAQLAEQLRVNSGERWTGALVDQKTREFNEDPHHAIFVVRGGVQYFGAEHLKDPALYKAVQHGMKRWGQDDAMRNLVPEILGRPPKGQVSGDWCYPDMVFRVIRRADTKPPRHVHSVEIEQANGFGIKSIYQAYEQGRGADFAWVFFAQPDPIGPSKRLVDVAKELGVGLVGMRQPTQPAKWKTHLGARARHVTGKARADFDRRITSTTVANERGAVGPTSGEVDRFVASH